MAHGRERTDAVEWVETTARTVEEAVESALDRLGIAADDAEIEVIEEPKAGLFGRMRGQARVRARVRPVAPRPKQERRRRTRRDQEGRSGEPGEGSGTTGAAGNGRSKGSQKRSGGSSRGRTGSEGKAAPKDPGRAGKSSGAGAGRGSSHEGKRVDRGQEPVRERDMMPEAEQREVGEVFLKGLLDGMGLEGDVESSLDSEGVLGFEVSGQGLGLLIGPGLVTLDAVQEICRNVIQRQAAGREYGKVELDVSGARADRKEALEEFTRAEARVVLDSGDEVVFDVMSRSDRKIVHDVIAEFPELRTESIGEDPRRRVVLRRG